MKFLFIKNFLLYEFPLLVFALFIFFFSSLEWSPYSGDFDAVAMIERKGAYVVEFLFFFLVLRVLLFRGVLRRPVALPWVILVFVLYAIVDEWHQVFVPYREGVVTDVIIDVCGIFLAVCVTIWWWYKQKNNYRQEWRLIRY